MNAALPFAALMETAKLGLVASYLFLPLPGSFPLLPAAASLFAALLLSLVQRRRGGLILFRLLAHAAGLALAFFFMTAAYSRESGIDALHPQGAAQIAALTLLSTGTLGFWIRGARLGSVPFDHARCVARFDEGIGLFLFGLSIAAVIGVRNPTAARLSVPFFLASVAALGISKNAGIRRGGLSRRTRGALIVPVALACLLGAAALGTLVPLLFAPAASAGKSLKAAFEAAEPHIGAFLRWLFGFRRGGAAADSTGSSNGGVDGPPILDQDSALGRLIARIAIWGLGGVVALLLMILALYGLAKLFSFLASRASPDTRGLELSFLPAWLRRIVMSAARAVEATVERLEAFLRARRAVRSPAAAAYLRLCRAARFAGARRLPSETPREYARRLEAAFPRAARDAAFVVEELEKEAYGGKALEPKSVSRLNAQKRRCRPALFITELILANTRLFSRLTPPRDPSRIQRR